MNEQEIKAKALEISALILGPPNHSALSNDAGKILNQYIFLADGIERHIRGSLRENPAKPAES